MVQKILAVNGSPRKGNTDFMLGLILEAAKNSGADVEEIKLKERKINFCDGGDDHCLVKHSCCIKDDMDEIYGKIEEADLIILASPSYFSNVTARMKNFMDRCNPYWFSKKLKGKKAFILGVGGGIDKSVKEMMDIFRTFLRILEMEEVGSYYTKADKINELKGNQKVIKEMEDIGASLK